MDAQHGRLSSTNSVMQTKEEEKKKTADYAQENIKKESIKLLHDMNMRVFSTAESTDVMMTCSKGPSSCHNAHQLYLLALLKMIHQVTTAISERRTAEFHHETNVS